MWQSLVIFTTAALVDWVTKDCIEGRVVIGTQKRVAGLGTVKVP